MRGVSNPRGVSVTRQVPILALLVLFLTGASSTLYAQVTNVDSTPATPIEGAGHDYIHFLSETVNPASGSISLRIQLPTQSGRGLTLPFSIDYDSGSANHMVGALGYAQWSASTGTMGQGGWSYGVPGAASTVVAITQTQYPNSSWTCYLYSNYEFRDPSGSLHPLGMGTVQASGGPTGQPGGVLADCPQWSPVPNGGDAEYTASYASPPFTIPTYGPDDPGPTPAPLIVASADGTVYYFSAGPLPGDGANSSAPQDITPPDYIEDRNGNRITSTFSGSTANNNAYNGNLTPGVTYGYDGVNLSCPTPIGFVGGNATNGVGRRTAMCDSSGNKSWAYDPMGRIRVENDRFIGLVAPYNSSIASSVNGVETISANTSYSYYLNGDLQGDSSPAWYEYYTDENSAGEITNVGDELFNVLYNTTYTPTGQLSAACISGDGCSAMTISNTYNSRLQPVLLSASTQAKAPILNLTYNFNPGTDNGNVIQIANGKDSNRTQNFLYDPLNRIWQAYTNGNSPLTTSWGETYSPTTQAAGTAFSSSSAGIDAWGNLTNRSGVTNKTYTEGQLNCPASTQNQLNTCYNYDAAGNLIKNGSVTYTYDAENRIIATAGTSYIYDGDGNRVEKCTEGKTAGTCTSNATGRFYWLHKDGGTLNESDLGGNFTAAYDRVAGQIAARIDLPANSIHYYFSDHLGSTNIVTDANGVVENESDYYPYGGEMVITSGGSNRYKFTGKERDAESGLDNFGARYNASSMGRFMSADPVFMNIMRVMDPQRLNLYAYGRNNPLVYTDPTGKDIVSGTGDQKAVRAALVEIAKHTGGRAMLTHLDQLTAKIPLSTGRAEGGDYGTIRGNSIQVTNNGKVVDAKGGPVEVTVDFKQAAKDRDTNKALREMGDKPKEHVPDSNAQQLGHELAHGEDQFYGLPDNEDNPKPGRINDILHEDTDMDDKQAGAFVDNLLKPNSNTQQQQPPPPPPCIPEKDKPCPK